MLERKWQVKQMTYTGQAIDNPGESSRQRKWPDSHQCNDALTEVPTNWIERPAFILIDKFILW